jgi:hypothetical protein
MNDNLRLGIAIALTLVALYAGSLLAVAIPYLVVMLRFRNQEVSLSHIFKKIRR